MIRALLLWLAACGAAETTPCERQLAPELRDYVCKAGLSADPSQGDHECPALACEAVLRNDLPRYFALLEGASQIASMTEMVLADADPALLDRFIATMDKTSVETRRQLIVGFAGATQHRDDRDRWVADLAGMVSIDKDQPVVQLEASLQALERVDARRTWTTALSIAFDANFPFDSRQKAVEILVAASSQPGFPMQPADYDVARTLYEAAKASAPADLTPAPRLSDPRSSTNGPGPEDVVALMAAALNTAPTK